MVGLVRPQFVLFGSSIVQLSFSEQGWGAILTDLYARKADIFVRGYSGWNSRRVVEVLEKVFPKDAGIQPSLVIVYFGGNDSMRRHPFGLGSHVPLPEYILNMKKIAIHLKSLSEKPRIIFLIAPPLNEEQIHQRLRCLLTVVDGIHLSSEGIKIVAKEILKVIRQTNWEPNLYYKSMPAEFGDDSPYDPVNVDGNTTLNLSQSFFEKNMQLDLEIICNEEE